MPLFRDDLAAANPTPRAPKAEPQISRGEPKANDVRTELAEVRELHAQELERMRLLHAQALEQARQLHIAEMDELRQLHQAEVDRMRELHASALAKSE